MADNLQTTNTDNIPLSTVHVEQADALGDEWDNLVTSHENHTVFHRSAWARVLTETYGHRPYYLKISVEARAAALVPLMEVSSLLTGRRGVSLPFADFAGILWSRTGQSPSVYQTLVNFATKLKWKHLELRGETVRPPGATTFLKYDGHYLDLRSGIDWIRDRLHPSVRRAIRKAEGSGLEVAVDRSMESLEQFYDLHGRTRRRHGLPPQPFAFFTAIAQHLIVPGLGEIVIARHRSVPVAGAIFLRSGGRVIYKFGASDCEHWPLRPNHLVMWNAIQYFASDGCSEFHFGRTSSNDAGLSRFKQSWGCETESLLYYRRGCGSDSWECANPQTAESYPLIFGHLSIGLNRFAGRLIYPHLD